MASISVDRTLPKPQDHASDGLDAVGFVQFWGNSPALDLLGDGQAAAFGVAAAGVTPGQQHSKEDKMTGEQFWSREVVDAGDAGAEVHQAVEPAPLPEEGPLNILVAGGADIRHLVKTVARRRGGGGRGPRLRFFLHESNHEVLARHILFLQVVNNTALPARERMEIFLSLYGNTLVRERDSRYVAELADEFVELVTDNSSHPLASAINMDGLKFKDRDILQDVFKGWRADVPFDIEALREQRSRGYYRDRYDFRKNMMDWDYQTHIKDKAGIINWFHYKAFCFTGVAFETRLASYNTSNRTLASYTEAKDRAKGTTVQVRGYWGDLINSPYWAFSIATNAQDRPRLFKVSGAQYRETETDIAEFNLTDYIGQLDTGEELHLPAETPEEHTFPYTSPMEGLRQERKVEEVEESKEQPAPQGGGRARGRRKPAKEWPPLTPAFEGDGVEVVLLSGDLREVLRKSKYRGLFHRGFLGAMAAMPFFEDAGLNRAAEDPFRHPESAPAARIRKPARKEKPELLGARRDDSAFAAVFAEGAEVVAETMKYQAHFDAQQRLAFRHRVAQAGHLFGWRLADEARAVPRMEHDMKERRAQELEKYATDFLRFVTGPTPAAAAAAAADVAG